MNILKALFGSTEASPEEEKKDADRKQFDLLKYDGVKAMKTGRFDYAVHCFTEALKMHDDDLEVRDYLSRTLVRLERLDEAIAQLEHITAAEPQNMAMLMQLAHVCYMKEDYARMADACRQAMQAAPQEPAPHFKMAQALLGQKDVAACLAELTQAIAMHPDYADARLMRAQILLALRQLPQAEADAQWLAEHIDQQEDVLLLCARIAHAKGNDDEAISLYDKVTLANPFMVEAYQERGQIYFQRGQKDLAQEDMQKVLELNPQQLADVSGHYSAEGVEQKTRQAYSAMNPFGL